MSSTRVPVTPPSLQDLVPTTFYLKKNSLIPISNAMAQMAKIKTSGRFARKVAKIIRRLSAVLEELMAERQRLVALWTDRYPDDYVDEKLQGKPKPVYAFYPDDHPDEELRGKPRFVQDEAGNDTSERMVEVGSTHIFDHAALTDDIREMMEEYTILICPPFTADEFNAFREIEPAILASLILLEEGSEATELPEGAQLDRESVVVRRAAMAVVPDDGKDETAEDDDLTDDKGDVLNTP